MLEISKPPVKMFDLKTVVTQPPATSVNITVTVIPPTGSVMVTHGDREPVDFAGPSETKEIPVDGPLLYFRLLQGATDCEVKVNHWSDGRCQYHRTANVGITQSKPL